MFFLCQACDSQNIKVSVDERDITDDIIDHPLKRLRSIMQARWHANKFVQPKRCCDGCFVYISWLYSYVVICFDKVYLG